MEPRSLQYDARIVIITTYMYTDTALISVRLAQARPNYCQTQTHSLSEEIATHTV